MGYNDASQPGGWFGIKNLLLSRKVIISTAALAAGSFLLYGSFQGRQAPLYAEVVLDACSASGCQTAQWPWPLSVTGVILADQSSYVFIDEAPSPASKMNIGVGASGSTGSTVASLTVVADQIYTLAGSGAAKLPGRILVGPGQYVTFGWHAGSGQTVGAAAGIARIKVEPCGNDSFTCD